MEHAAVLSFRYYKPPMFYPIKSAFSASAFIKVMLCSVNKPFQFTASEAVFISQTILKRMMWPMADSEDEDEYSSVEETFLLRLSERPH